VIGVDTVDPAYRAQASETFIRTSMICRLAGDTHNARVHAIWARECLDPYKLERRALDNRLATARYRREKCLQDLGHASPAGEADLPEGKPHAP